MDINELESYRLSDALKFQKKLNPQLWDNEQLRTEVRDRLVDMADDFREFLGITDLEVKDITVSGSNAAYNYTPTSDIDLHLVVDIPKLSDEIYRELFDAKKYQYNDQHDFRIGDHEVELYVQPSEDEHRSQGIYSVQDQKWLRVPSRRKPKVNDISVRSKYQDLGHRIEKALERADYAELNTLYKKIVRLRKSGLEDTGEFGPENLAFKLLRKNGLIDELRNARNSAKDKMLSLTEKKKRKKKTTFGKFNGAFFPGYGYYGNASSTDTSYDGGGDAGGESVKESTETPIEKIIDQFVEYCAKELAVKSMPQIKLKHDPQWSKVHHTFGKYDPDADVMYISVANRHPVDVLRTIAHELVHNWQDENMQIPPDAGATGSKYENHANAGAGIIMRNFAQLHPEYFEINESTGFIPTDSKLAHDPRYVMGLTGDIKPGETQRQAAKLGMKIDKSGSPPLLHKSAAKNTTANKAMNLGLTENWARTGINKVLYQKAYQVAYDILNKIWTRKQAEQGHPKHALEYYASQIARQFPENIIDARVLADMVRNQQLDEIWGFAAGKSVPAWKRGKIKKKKEKFEPSAYDKLVARRQAAAKGDKEAFRKSFKDLAKDPEVAEGYRLQLERGSDMDVLHITDTATGKRTEVRGKPDYETAYDADDKLHQLLDRIGKASNISDLINGEPVGINPRHPDGDSAKKHADTAFNENFADGKVKGKSRPGRVKAAGASCKGSVTDLRAKAKKYSGERGKMYHWCANMKAGKKK